MEEEQFIDFTRARHRQNGRIQYSRDELLEIGRKPGLSALPVGINMSVIRELEELTFFDSGPKPEWGKEKGHGRLDFLRPGGGFGGPIRSRLVGDGSLPEELPPARSLEPHVPPRPSEGLDIRRASSWRPPPEGGAHTPPGDRWNGPVTPGRRPAEELPARRGRWDEAKTGTTPERETWRSNSLQSPSNGDERSWRGAAPGAAPGPRPPGPPGRWGEEERPRGTGWGPRGSLEERELPRRPPPGMGHEDKWTRGGPAPGGWEHERDREWGGRREGGGYGGAPHWDRDPSWMHDGQQAGDAVAGPARMPPPPARAGAMTAKDIERERQEMQAQWRVQAAANKAKEEDDLAFLRSDSDEDEPSGIRPPAAVHLETAGSHPSRSRFFDVPSGDISSSNHHHQQPGTPSGAAAADPSVVGRKLTFDQFKAAAAGSAGGPAGDQPLQHQGSGAAAHAKAVTLAEVERQVSGNPLHQLQQQQQPPPPPPPPAGPAGAAPPPPGVPGADKRVDTEASKKLMAFLKKPAGPTAGAPAAPAPVMKPPPGMGFASPTATPAAEKLAAPGGPAAEAGAAAAGLKAAVAAASTSDAAAAHEADGVDDLAKLAGLLDLGLEEDTAASGLAAKLASLAQGDPEVTFGGKRDSSTGLSPTLGGFESVLAGSKQVPSALAGIWGTGLGVWDHAPKLTGAAGPSLLPAGSSPFAAAAGIAPAASAAPGGPQQGDGLRASLGQGLAGLPGVATGVSGPSSVGAAGIKSPPTVPGAGGPSSAQGTNALAQLLASAAAGAQSAARPPTASMPFANGPAGLGQAGLNPAAIGQVGSIARPQAPGAGPASGSGGIAASNPLAMLFAGQAKQLQQQQQQLGMPGVGAGTAARPPGVNLQAQQLLQQQQQQPGQQQSNLAGLMQQLQQQQAQQQALAAGRAGMTLQQAQQQQLQQQQAQQRAAAAFTQQQQQQQLLGAARPQQTQQNLQYLLQQQQQQQAQMRQQQQQHQQQQLMLAQQLAQNQAVQAASLAARSAAMGGGMPPNQFMQGAGAQLPGGFGGMGAAQRPGLPQGFNMAPQDQQAQLRQLLSQAQQRVPGMPGMS